MRKYFYFSLLFLGMIISSCSSHDYINAIPGNSTALMSVNAQQFASAGSPFATLLAPFVDKESKQLKGIDLTKDIFLFESGDGSLGMSAPISDAYDLDDFLKRLKNLGVVGEFNDIEGVTYCTLDKSWVVGYDDNLLLIMGPVTGADAEKQMMKRMSRMIDQDEDHCITSSDLWKHLQNIQAPMRMVAMASALPEQMVASVTLGSPKGTNPSDVLVEGSMSYNEGTLYLDGSTSSFNTNVDQALKNAASNYRPLTIDWEKKMNDSIFAGIFMNVDGDKLMPFLQDNRALNTMLMGSTAYDRIRGNKGDMMILISPKGDSEGNDASDYIAQVRNMPKGTYKTKERLVVCLNLEALTGSASESIAPFINKIHRIVYRMK